MMESIPWLTLIMLTISPLIAGAPSSCSGMNHKIKGGSISLSEDGRSVIYICPENYYPTVSIRRCMNERWSPLPQGKRLECKKITCPDPRVFENGEVNPYSARYFVNDTTRYMCHSGYEFRGSETRVCQANGKWSGSTPICGRNSDHCPDPGVPAGTSRKGNIFNIDDKVTYRCDDKLTLVGSKERICKEDGQWSGTEPECYADFTYDTPEEASDGFSSSLMSNLQLTQELEGTDQHGKKIQVHKGGKLDIYIALDFSDSIDEKEFSQSKEVIITLIEKISYYEASPNYEIIFFATDVYRIVSMTDFKNSQENKLLQTIEKLKNYKYDSKGKRSGTNIAEAYRKILESMTIEQMNNPEDFKQTQHIVIMFTDGQANMGGSPKPWVNKIKNIVQKHSAEEKLELYVFGLGKDVHAEDIIDLKTDRGNEKFFFKLQSLNDLQETFDKMIDEGNSVALCGLYQDYGENSEYRRQHPWLAEIFVTHNKGKMSNCLGSFVTSSFILTAAHCFKLDDKPGGVKISVDEVNQRIKVKNFILHPSYNVLAKQNLGIPEYYEFDLALIQLEEPVIMSPDLRPICIPCTKETNGALRLSDQEGTCKKHKEILMTVDNVKAAFLSKIGSKFERKDIKIKQGKQRKACVEDAKKATGMKATNADDIVTDNFLCSGGIYPTTDHVACKGDSGGATFVVPGGRMVQVGIVSWGVEDICRKKKKALSLSHTRDYHTNLFSKEILSFLKTFLGDQKLGTPLTFLRDSD